MEPISPISASLNSRWNARLFPYSGFHMDRRFSTVPSGMESSAAGKERVLSVPLDPYRGRQIDIEA